MKKNILGFVVLIFIASMFCSCGEREKEISISENVKQEVKADEINEVKFKKIRDIDFQGLNCAQLIWKEDENITLVENGKYEDEFVDQSKYKKSDVNIYNLNVNNFKFTKIKSLKDIVCLDLNEAKFGDNLLYSKSGKVYIYNEKNNTEKEIYDLSELNKEEDEYPKHFNIVEGRASDRAKLGFVRQTNGRYVYIMGCLKLGTTAVRIIDLNTGKLGKGYEEFLGDSLSASNTCFCTYDKEKDDFYMSTLGDKFIYQFKLKDEINFKKLKIEGKFIFSFCDKEKYIYLGVLDPKENRKSIKKFDKEENKSVELLHDKVMGPEKNEGSFYGGIDVNNTHNLVAYTLAGGIRKTEDKKVKLKTSSYIGRLDGDKIKNIRKITKDTEEGKDCCNYIIFSPKGDKFIYVTQTTSNYEGKVKIGPIKASLYEIK